FCSGHAGHSSARVPGSAIRARTRQEARVTTETKAKAPLRQRAVHEFREFLFLSAYLYVTLGAVILMKAGVLHAEGMDVTLWGSGIVKAMVLAKFMLVGRAMGIGERITDGPL